MAGNHDGTRMSSHDGGLMDRRAVVGAGIAALTAPPAFAAKPKGGQPMVETGAGALHRARLYPIAKKSVGLITNQTGVVEGRHLADVMAQAGNVRLQAIFAPEHGFRGKAEAGATVANDRDAKTGVPIYSLHGDVKAPTDAMLRDVNVLVFDIQDIGVRFYTYISTMGLAMQAAARRRIPFVVLDRPNPLGLDRISGFVLEPSFKSFVGQYPMPIVHGMTVAELAHMIKGERWLDGLDTLDLQVMKCEGLTRRMRWPSTGLPWIATSPNIPTFESALVYPGIGIVGETLVNEGRGTPTPFSQFGAPWLDAARLASELTAMKLPGVRFEAVRYVPQSIRNVAETPRFKGETVNGVRIAITDVDKVRPHELGIHALSLLQRQARSKGRSILPDNRMFQLIAGTERLKSMLAAGRTGLDVIASWQAEVAAFEQKRAAYLLY